MRRDKARDEGRAAEPPRAARRSDLERRHGLLPFSAEIVKLVVSPTCEGAAFLVGRFLHLLLIPSTDEEHL
ncbi:MULTISPECIES: hypothetical protein [unclassified Streptomyces]|uniref:hypothetical protein n=1 Tax=unclassified Streptomyces TaxID=2593676 RepID=UPI002DD7B385|nr:MULTISPECIES: hypothetical protein [unclassified Streptomyces]WSA92710.1 hypothetical protein OIE63_14905 [Streptomyces sp. NBC_01795]WSB77081.1 hypothetical protein OHB04_15740 [Streptomyces sp. NBC_01775]WSS14652.1 hypothetical protein OG533_24235 [Streptomyces sp. NBC_01186]WSS43466.1 hypothetical protein OG220_24905 [Streptomyces sp. NBC_01187]